MKKIKKLVKKYGKWGMVVIALGVGFVVGSFWVSGEWIGHSVKEQCRLAQEKYEKDCVESLIMMIDNNEDSLRMRNRSIWALGQMGDERGLEVLKKYYTGKIPDKEPYDKTLSQYEMKKAIKLLEGGFNATAVLWR